MKVNDVLQKEDKTLRILEIRDGRVFCVDCNAATLPKWRPISSLSGYTPAEAPTVKTDTTPKQKQTAYKRFTLIAPILSFVSDEAERRAMTDRVAKESGVSKQTLRRYLCRFLAYQTVDALAPVFHKREQTLTTDQKNMRRTLNKYFYTPKKSTLTEVYVKLLKEKYRDGEGNLLPVHPSLRQFRYFEHKYRRQENYLISRNGLKNYQRNDRPLLGEGVQEFAPHIGVGMLDATVCDVYLINKQGQIVGRPVLTAAVDANTSLCMGYSLSWEGGVYALRQLMRSIVADKTALCRQLGIEIDDRQWPVSSLPGVMVTDMGAEYVGKTFEQITELGVTLVNLPPFRPDLKGPVEKLFDLIQEKYRDALKGKGAVMPDFRERGTHDYRKDACLTLEEFERIVVRCIVYYNAERLVGDYPYTSGMTQAHVRPYACDIWAYKAKEPGANLIRADEREIALTLLPRTEGRFSRCGFTVNKLRYHRDGYKEAYLKGGKGVAAYDPDDVSSVWLKTEAGFEEFRLIGTAFGGQTLAQVNEARKNKETLVKNESEEALRAKIRLMEFIETAADKKKPSENASTAGIRNNRRKERRKTHKTNGEVIKDE